MVCLKSWPSKHSPGYFKSLLYYQVQVSHSTSSVKVAQWGFSGLAPPKFGHNPHCHQQRFGKITTTAVLDKDEHCVVVRVTMTSELQ